MDLKRYQNPTNRLKDGSCCDIAVLCLNDCDPYFSFTYHGMTRFRYPKISGSDIKYTSQSVHFVFNNWQVSSL